jgi:hypothetical protein
MSGLKGHFLLTYSPEGSFQLLLVGSQAFSHIVIGSYQRGYLIALASPLEGGRIGHLGDSPELLYNPFQPLRKALY